MKNFKNYTPEKYSKPEFQKVEEGIYRTKDPYGIARGDVYVTSLSFEAEPDCYGEEESSPQYISQVPFEALLDEFLVYVTDFYEKENEKSKTLCYQEFGATNLADIQNLRTLIGKRCYAVPYEEDGEEYYNIVIE
ncbi:MAG: hypothetical protein K2O32_07395 [Acetatifactor sp.]|nr:hypothetical protein [Acetatifactor sp.]